jgi:hypothetical protein
MIALSIFDLLPVWYPPDESLLQSEDASGGRERLCARANVDTRASIQTVENAARVKIRSLNQAPRPVENDARIGIVFALRHGRTLGRRPILY